MTDPSRCSQCGAPFVCGYAAGHAECWCAQQPFLPATDIVPDQLCLCPDCLGKKKAALVNRPDECQNLGDQT
ncbi:cysteine-rich CWC family protein [Cupriavidus plantarum]|uniref:cysteine-rich CWC family protein n=1 Tax=Cupriavidus plantarum TaxID=942865 RepID=UPI000EB18481|nr:cysteine-rich CWC family protein [Cupriavidus plantarum]RLK35956.1 hypothetical protein C7417_3730 [Cupriavidus plantarum]CAG2126728.1 hypothetical protein LMG26296_00079 [Cupriavidus plantarum]SMR67776.1 Cysteine-rich CWC [Cupriavidus plantarum]